MELRRNILFFALALLVMVGWTQFVLPRFFPPQQQQQAAQQDPDGPADADDERPDEDDGKDQDAAEKQDDGDGKDSPAVAEKDDAPPEPADDDPQDDRDETADLPDYPGRTLVLGSDDPDSGVFLQAELTSRGAAVETVTLNDPRYKDLVEPHPQLKVVGHHEGPLKSLETRVHQVDGQLFEHGGKSLASVHWRLARLVDLGGEVVFDEESGEPVPDELPAAAEVTFAYPAPDGKLEVRKTYRVKPVDLEQVGLQTAQNEDPQGYTIGFELEIRNTSREENAVSYELQGPVGVPLENVENTRKYRDVKVGFRYEDGSIDDESLSASDLVDQEQDDDVETWTRGVAYIGVDVQFFAALLLPQDDDAEDSWLESTKAVVIDRADDEERSDISVLLRSKTIPLAAGDSLVHRYDVFAGPKRQELLEPISADGIMDFGWFGFVSKAMLGILKFFHDYLHIGSYGVCIILLTVLVRGMMFPLSRKQAAGTQKMKELQPKIAELKKKYENDKEKLAREQMKLFSEHGYNPLAGCLPIFFQLPIFIGLYQALNNSVDLRMASFLWFGNLAAPDQLIRDIGFTIPFLGTSAFNLLPLVTVVLFIVQQKMFMPPPADEQQEMQYKMMNVMMLVMGFLFYKVPSGLCLYFIASGLWGIGERKLLEHLGAGQTTASGGDDSGGGGKGRKGDSDDGPGGGGPGGSGKGGPNGDKGPKGLMGRLLEMADAAGNQTAGNKPGSSPDGNGAGKGGKKPRRKSRTRR